MSLDRHAYRRWLDDRLSGPFAHLKGMAGFVDAIPERRRWEEALGAAGYGSIAWPVEWGGKDASVADQVAFAQEYAAAGAPARITHVGIELAGPTILAYGTDEQKRRFLPDIGSGRTIWAQGYSEPNAGSDLANIRTTARLEGDRWIVDGQKIWTSLGPIADWIFVIARTTPGSRGREGLSYLLMPIDQPGVTVRPIRQMTGEAEFAEVFFDGAVAGADSMIGRPGQGWEVAMATLAFERGVSTVVQQMRFGHELDRLIAIARANGKAHDPIYRQKIADAWIGLQVLKQGLVRTLSDSGDGQLGHEALTSKLSWSRWHRALGDLAMDIQGMQGEIGKEGEYHMPELTHMHLSSRADTIYAGTSQIQRNIISEQGLGLPREPRGAL